MVLVDSRLSEYAAFDLEKNGGGNRRGKFAISRFWGKSRSLFFQNSSEYFLAIVIGCILGLLLLLLLILCLIFRILKYGFSFFDDDDNLTIEILDVVVVVVLNDT